MPGSSSKRREPGSGNNSSKLTFSITFAEDNIMKKSNTKSGAFIDKTYIPLDSKIKIVIAIVIILVPILAFYFGYYKPNLGKTKALIAQRSALELKLRNVKKKASNLAKLEKEVAEAEELFVKASALLPRESEIPKLLTDISALGRNAGLDFLTFKPQADNPKDFYAEMPISINVRGPYHNMGFFFDQVSKLERIVTVANVNMSSPHRDAGEMILNSTCRLVTYRFTNVELPKPPKQ